MADPLFLIVITIIIALIFDFGNGLNDAANAISTIVATKVLSMKGAVLLAATGNFIGAFVFNVAVATTIGKGIVDPTIVNAYIIMGGLIGAIVWVYACTFIGLPISASHSLIGGFVGSAIFSAGFQSIIWKGFLKILIFIFLAPIIGFIGGYIFFIIILWFSRKASPSKINIYFKKLQILSSSVYSIGHGTNDAQKTMGIIAILLFSNGLLGATFHVPFWVILASHGTIALGTIAGGWKVVKTMGMKITQLRPVHGFSAETSGAATIIGCTLLGIPVSTTHVISGAIMGVGSTRRFTAVRWKLARKILWAWILTIPTSAFVGGLSYYLISVIRAIF